MPARIAASGFREYDARWRYPEEIDRAGMRRLGLGLGTQMQRRGLDPAIVVGHDLRSYSPEVAEALVAGLIEAGIVVHDVGLALTPMAYFAQVHLGLPAVAMVTASHNPNGWTGVKMGFEAPLTHAPEDMAELRDIVLSGATEARPGGARVADPRALHHEADAGATVLEGDEPRPTLDRVLGRRRALRHVRRAPPTTLWLEDDDLDVALLVALASLDATKVREERRVVEAGDGPVRRSRSGDDGGAPRRVDDGAGRQLDGRTVAVGQGDAHLTRRALEVDAGDRRAADDRRPELSGPLEQRGVELVARRFERMHEPWRDRAFEAEAFVLVVAVVVEPRAALLDEALAEPVDQAERREDVERSGHERLAHTDALVARLALDHEDATATARQLGRAHSPARSAADDDDVDGLGRRRPDGRERAAGGHSAVLGGGPSWMRSPMYAPMSVNMMPMALMIT